MSRESALAKNTLVLALGTVLPKAASFVTLPILTGCLTTNEYGTYDLVLVLASLLLPAVTLRMDAAVFRFLIDTRERVHETKVVVSNALAFVLVASLIALVAFFLLLPGDSTLLKVLICCYFLVEAFASLVRQCARGLGDNFGFSLSAIVSSIAQMLLAVMFVYLLGYGLLGCMFMLLCAEGASLAFIVLRTRFFSLVDFGSVRLRRVTEMLGYSWPMVPNTMSMWVMAMSSRLVVTFFMGVSANAMFAVAYKLPQLVTLVQNAFGAAWQENASLSIGDSDSDSYYSRMFRIAVGFMGGATGVLIGIAPALFAILIQGDYDQAYSQVPILFTAMFFYALVSFVGGIYVAHKKMVSVGITTVAAAAVNLVIDIVAIPHIGLYAASGAMLVSYAFLLAFRMVDIRKYSKVRYDVPQILLVVAVLGLQCVLGAQRELILDVVNAAVGITLFVGLNIPIIKFALRMVKSKVVKRRG